MNCGCDIKTIFSRSVDKIIRLLFNENDRKWKFREKAMQCRCHF